MSLGAKRSHIFGERLRQIIVVGGAVSSALDVWLQELGIQEYTHFSVEVVDISPSALQEAANRLYNSIPLTAMVISVGRVADKLLNLGFVIHGSLPEVKTKDKKRVASALQNCKNYLTLRRYYDQPPGNTIS